MSSQWFKKISPPVFWGIIVLPMVSLLWKLLFIGWGVLPFNSDEAIVALMARHILSGEHPAFFYGQAYMGSLDAYLVAGAFSILGYHVWVIRLVQSILYLLTIIITVLSGRLIFGDIKYGSWGAVFMVFPTVNVFLYTTVSLGGYGEAMLLGSSSFYVGVLIAKKMMDKYKNGDVFSYPAKLIHLFGLWGFLAGLGFWVNGLSLVFTVPIGVIVLLNSIKLHGFLKRPSLFEEWLACAIGFSIGALPWIYAVIQQGPLVYLRELMGSAVAVEQQTWIVRSAEHLLSLILLGVPVIFGFRPPWEVSWILLPLIPLVAGIWVYILSKMLRIKDCHLAVAAGYLGLWGILCFLGFGFVFTSFGIDPSGRYFLPAAFTLALFAGRALFFLQDKKLRTVLLIVVIGYQMWGCIESGIKNPPGITTQFNPVTVVDHQKMPELIQFLQSKGETRGHTNYWVSYPLAFQSREELIFVPTLPYHLDFRYTPRDNRYLPYNLMLEEVPRVAYITTHHPSLDDRLRKEFRNRSITWEEIQIGDYQVFFHLSTKINPDQLGFDK